MLNILLAFCAVMALAFALHTLFDIKSGVSPLLSLCTVILVNLLAGLAGMLKAGAVAGYLLAAGLFALSLYKNKTVIKQQAAGFFTAPVIMFIISSGFMFLFLAAKQPLMGSWDEFSFWGTARKLVKEHDALYTFYQSSMLGTSIPPAMPVLCYFFQRFGAGFCEWACFFAYDVLIFACFAAVASSAQDRWPVAAGVYISAFLIPFIFRFTGPVSYIQTVYITVYSDLPMAGLFAGRFAVYLNSRKNSAGTTAVCLPLAVLVFVKDMGLALAAVCVFVMFFDSLLSAENLKENTLKKIRGRAVAAVAMLAVCAAAFVGWSAHLSAASGINRTDFGGSSQMGMVQIVLNGLKELLLGPAGEKFTAVKSAMFSAFFNRKVAMPGSGFAVVCLTAAVILAAFTVADKKDKPRRLSLMATGSIGFAGYYIFHLFLYVYVFRDDAYGLVSYERYMNIYYTGWLLMALCMLAVCRQGRRKNAAGALVLTLTAVFARLFGFYADSGNLFVACNENYPSFRKNVMVKADFIRPYIDSEDVIYCYSGYDDGLRWFIYTFEFSNNYIVKDFTVDTRGLDGAQIKEKCQREMKKYFLEKGVSHILIDSSSAEFVEIYGELFDVPMNDIGMDSLGYYKVNYTDGGLYFTLEKGGYIADGKDL